MFALLVGDMTRPRLAVSPAILLALAGLFLSLMTLATPINHDESQYVAGAVLAARSAPFRDFIALQPPLALRVWAPLTWLFPGWNFLAIRLSSAMFGLITLAAVADGERQSGDGNRRWPIGAALLACTNIFLFTSSVARNDALPGMCLALAMAAGLRGIAGKTGWLGPAGLFFGAAAAAKLSFAPALAAAGLMMLIHAPRIGVRGLAAFALGAATGLLPLIVPFLCAPDAFVFGVIRMPLAAPFDWYARTGDAGDLTLMGKLLGAGGAMLVGPALAAFAIVVVGIGGIGRDPRVQFLLALMAGGLVGALLPTPTHPQYLLPLLPPLFALLPRALERIAWRRSALIGLGLFAVIGLAPSLAALGRGFPALTLEKEAHEIGRQAKGPIATLAPERVVDSSLTIDARFATGPFLFRSGSVLRADEAWRYKAATPATLNAMFAVRPPGALLVGHEPGWRAGMPPVDRPLELWARRHGYRELALPDGVGRLYVAPPPTGDRR